jgi:CheY-like chemotaxis protein
MLGERYDVTICAGGREALTVLKRERGVDAIVCDLVMPGTSGTDLYETIGTIRPELRDRFLFVIAGALAQAPREARDFLAFAAAPCLARPFTASAALDAVANLIRDADTEATTPPARLSTQPPLRT